MDVIQIEKGRNIRLKGTARREIVEVSLPSLVAVQPPDFRGIKPRPLVKPGDVVKVGSPVLEDKNHPGVRWVSPVSGAVKEIKRGEKRALLAVEISVDGKQTKESFPVYTPEQLSHIPHEAVVEQLLDAGVWPCLRQRPFSKMANPQEKPKSIFVRAMSTDPLDLDPDVLLRGREGEFQAGLDVLRHLTSGEVHLCFEPHASAKALTEAKNVSRHIFSGPHPAGNVGTHIYHVDPIRKGDVVWYIGAEDVLRVAHLFLKGAFSPERTVALAGEGVAEDRRSYFRTVIGAPLAFLLERQTPSGYRYISGSVLSGREVGPQGFVGFYDSQVTVIREGGERQLLGWMSPGFDKFSFSRTFLSALNGDGEEVSLDTDTNGSHRAIVMNHIYDDYVVQDVPVFFLLRAVIAGDNEEAERLGILECDEEDFALCSFACPSKTDVGAIIRRGLDVIEKEG